MKKGGLSSFKGMIGNNKGKKETEVVSALSNNINKGTKVKGEIEAQGNLRIDGEVEGDIYCKAKLVLGETSIIKGNVISQNAEVAGKVEGKISISEMLILKGKADVKGDIITGQLMVESGASFNGTSKMGKEIKLDERGKESTKIKTA